jgi:hypothetical protein
LIEPNGQTARHGMSHFKKEVDMKNEMTVRQGDVLLRRVESIPETAKVAEKKDQAGNDRIVLAYGEVTGHAHAIHDLDVVDVFVTGEGVMYLQVKEEAKLQHEEHGTIALPPGNYERTIQREYSPEAIRDVRD